MRSGCSACSRSRSGCRSSRSPPTIRCCRPGSCAPAIPTAPTRISSMPPPISAVSWRCCPIRCCWSRCSRCARQNLIWTGGYGLLIVLIAACGVLLLRSPVDGGGRSACRGSRRAGAAVDPARALDLPRRGAVGPAGRGHRAYLHRRRRGAAAVGAAAVALSADLGAGVPVAAAAAAQMDPAAAAAGDRRRHRAARVSAANRTCC